MFVVIVWGTVLALYSARFPVLPGTISSRKRVAGPVFPLFSEKRTVVKVYYAPQGIPGSGYLMDSGCSVVNRYCSVQ